jgi:hypothetical protein
MNRLISLGCALSLAGCGGTGTLTFTTWGEEYIETRIPMKEGMEAGFVDGWSLSFSKFIATFKNIALAQKTGGSGPAQMGAVIVDLTKKGPVPLLTMERVPAGKWDKVSYGIAPDSAAAPVGTIAMADVATAKDGGLSVWIEGTATKGAATKRFDWRFTTDTRYEDCTNKDFGEGVTVAVGGTETVQLTIHGDHFFYDDLASGDPSLRFETYAQADANRDNTITLEELAQVQLTTLPVGTYGTGSVANVRTLRDFVSRLVRTIGHFRGEGECTVIAR